MLVELEAVIAWLDKNLGNYSDYVEINWDDYMNGLRAHFKQKWYS